MKYYIEFIAWKVSSFYSNYFITNWMVWKEIEFQLINFIEMSCSYIASMVKMEFVIKINVFGLRDGKSGLQLHT